MEKNSSPEAQRQAALDQLKSTLRSYESSKNAIGGGWYEVTDSENGSIAQAVAAAFSFDINNGLNMNNDYDLAEQNLPSVKISWNPRLLK